MLSHLGSKAIIFAVLSFLSVSQISIAQASSVRDLREKCALVLDITNSKNRQTTDEELLNAGVCIGQMIAEIRWRNTLCALYESTGEQILQEFGRKMFYMDAGQTAQAFVNWANNNPELWNKDLFDIEVQQSMFSKYNCK